MNKSKVATEIIEDIYTFNEKYEKAKNKFKNGIITEAKYATVLHILLIKSTYLLGVVDELKNLGYKFMRYEKEVCVLEDLIEQISDNLDNSKIDEITISEKFSLVTYLTKYEKVIDVFKYEYEELKDKVEHN